MPFLRFLRHLRLQFQLVLAPVFLLGYLLTGAEPDAKFIALFFLVHVCLYGGATAYNSYWDQDEGPVGGMKRPPPAGKWELWGGLGLQLVAVGAMGWWGWRMGLAAAAMVAMGIAYSHPRWRLKGRPLASLLTVTAGQGVLPLLMGLEAGGWERLDLDGWLLGGVLCATALIITGFYPLTQVYQIEEDRRRGDRCFAVKWGAAHVFTVARWLVGLGMGFIVALVAAGVFQPFWIWSIPLAYMAFWSVLHLWKRRFFRQNTYENHNWAFAISLVFALAFWAFIAVEYAVHSAL